MPEQKGQIGRTFGMGLYDFERPNRSTPYRGKGDPWSFGKEHEAYISQLDRGLIATSVQPCVSKIWSGITKFLPFWGHTHRVGSVVNHIKVKSPNDIIIIIIITDFYSAMVYYRTQKHCRQQIWGEVVVLD